MRHGEAVRRCEQHRRADLVARQHDLQRAVAVADGRRHRRHELLGSGRAAAAAAAQPGSTRPAAEIAGRRGRCDARAGFGG